MVCVAVMRSQTYHRARPWMRAVQGICEGGTLRVSTMDPASGIGIPVAFGAGLISFLSPCVLPLVPGYISAVAGVTPSEIRPRRVLGPSLAFVGSFSVIFIALGLLGQQALHGELTGPTAQKVSGALIVL